jgi:transposase
MRDAMLGLAFWEGHVVDSSQERADGSLLLSLSEDPAYRPRCGRCGSDCVLIHERRRRCVWDRDWFDRVRPGGTNPLPERYDLFHVVARFGRDVVDRVRVDQANALRSAPAQRRVIERSRWLLLRHRDNLGDEQAVKLGELLAANAPLATVYLLKTAIKIWFAPTVREGARRWKDWYRLTIDSGIAPAIAFAKRLRKYRRGILASAIFPLNTNVLEGVNNRIKVIKRMAYGFRDSAYFFLKIKAAFPGKAR